MDRRQLQVADEIKQIISVLIQRELKDPRIGFVTVTDVRVSGDLRYARIFVSVMGTPEEQRDTMAALTSGRGFIRREVAARMSIRFVPEIQFRLDKGAEYSSEINQLLNELRLSEGENVEDANTVGDTVEPATGEDSPTAGEELLHGEDQS